MKRLVKEEQILLRIVWMIVCQVVFVNLVQSEIQLPVNVSIRKIAVRCDSFLENLSQVCILAKNECPENEMWMETGGEYLCSNLNKSPYVKFPACYCKAGFARDIRGICIPVEECPNEGNV